MTDHEWTPNAGPADPPPPPPAPPYEPAPYQPAPYQAAPYQTVSTEQQDIWRSKGRRRIGFGVVWLLLGILVTAYTFSMSSGEVYIFFWGPLVYGLFQIISGVWLLNRQS
jgi:hypothetical protein